MGFEQFQQLFNPTAEQLEMFQTQSAYLVIQVPGMLSGLIAMTAMCVGFLNVLIARALSKHVGAELRPMAAFADWQLSKGFLLGSAILLVGSFLLAQEGVYNAGAMFSAAMALAVGPLALNGLCLLAFTQRLQKRPKGRFIITVATLIILTIFLALSGIRPITIDILTMLGLYERISRLRTRIQARSSQ
jgi:uncharacterized protein YybS (DUF2232 family)